MVKASRAEGPGKIRLFAALDLPEPVRAGLEAWGARELNDPALRPVPNENLHMTLCFLGWTPPERAAEAPEVIAAVKPRPVPVRLRREPVAKPPRRPSLVAIEAVAPAAAILAEELSAEFCGRGLAKREHRTFWPHVTVARVRADRRGRGSRRRPQSVKRLPGLLPEELGGEFRAVRLCLYRSMMRRDGSQYVPIHNVDLR